MNTLFCGHRDDVKILLREINERFYYSGEFIENADLNVSLKTLLRAINRNDTLIVDLDFLSTTTAVLLALAEEHHLEIIGYYQNEKPQDTRYSAVCDAVLNIDDVVDYMR